LSAFFQQWLSQPGHPHLVGDWQYHARTKQLTVTLRQTQPRRFEVPLEVGIRVGTAPLRLETLRLDQAEHTFTFDVETRPDTVVLDPHTWLLMEATFGPKR
jgi:aminopeptidase N